MKQTFLTVLSLMLTLVVMSACSDKKVTVSGVVLSVDTLTPAVGVDVYVYGDETIKSAATTGADGVFTMEITEGTQNLLVTDDLDNAGTLDVADGDLWFPTLNVDTILPVFTETVTELQIHACPTNSSTAGWGADLGSLAVWDNYLENGDTADDFEPTTSGDATGILSMVIFESPPTSLLTIPMECAEGSGTELPVPHAPEITVTMDEADDFGPVGYVNGSLFFNVYVPNLACLPVQDPSVSATYAANEIMMNGATETGPFALVQSWGKSTFDGDSVTVSLTDNAARDIAMPQDVEIPVEAGMISLYLLGIVDDELTSAQAALCALGYSQVGCD